MAGSLLPRARDGWPEGQGWGVPSRGRGQRPPSGLGQEPASAPRLRAQQPGKGPEAGQESTISAVGGVPYGRSQEGPLVPGVGAGPEQAAARKT